MSLCLTMIVKNEAHVIRRCLDSALPIIDSWSIVDTGSTDGTQEIIRSRLAHLPGELHEKPWVDFATNRNQAIELAIGRASHALVQDADDVLEIKKKPSKTLPLDCYGLQIRYGELQYVRPHIFRPELPQYRYRGVRHEFLQALHVAILDGVTINILGGGARSQDPEKFKNDALAIEKAIQDEPDLKERYTFYLAQSWMDAKEFDKALKAYEERYALEGGFAEERYISLLNIGKILQWTGRDVEDVMDAYIAAYEFRPSRIESLYELSLYLRLRNRFALAALFADAARKAPMPSDLLFVNRDAYQWRALDEFAISAGYVPTRYAQAVEAGQRLLQRAPAQERPRILDNMRISKEAMR